MRIIIGLVAASLVAFSGCEQSAPSPAADSDTLQSHSVTEPERLATRYLPNAVRVHEKVISGGLPAGDEGFAELESLGVKTIISVDGAKPEVEMARKYGLRYVHLPHGYDGIPAERAQQLAKAVRDLEGPIYIHCHHGKHRSPAAASVACVSAGLVPADHAVAILKIAGTSENYRGLFADAAEARKLDSTLLDALQVEFKEIAELPPLAEAMVQIEHVHDRVKVVSLAGWRIPREHPDLDPAHEVLLLREQYTELLRTDDVAQRPAEFRDMLTRGETQLEELETALRQWLEVGQSEPRPTSLDEKFEQVSAGCKTCHQKYRDVPRRE